MNAIKTLLTTSREALHVIVPVHEIDQVKITTLVGLIIEYPLNEYVLVWKKVAGFGYLPVSEIATLDQALVYFNIAKENAA